MKERVTITIESDLLRKLDDKVDGSIIKNRSHAIELLIAQSFRQEMPHCALIMAAGNVSKIKNVPVHMAKIGGKPVLEHLIDLFRKYNVTRIFIAVCYFKDMIKNYFGDGSRFGVSIHYIDEDEPSGTSSLLKKMQPYVNGAFFVTNADELKDFNLADMYAFHKQNKISGTIALTTVDDPSSYGIITMDGNKITTFKEKSRINSDSKIINSGVYLFDQEIMEHIPKGSRMLYDFLPGLAHEGKLFGYLFSGQWFDVHSPELFEKAKRGWKSI